MIGGGSVEWVDHRHSRAGIALQRPKGWPVLQDAMGAAIILMYPSEGDGFRPNLNVVYEQPPQRPDLTQHLRLEQERLARYLNDYRHESRKKIEVNGHETQRTRGIFRQGAFDIVLDQWNIVDRDRIVTVSAAAERADHSWFLPIAEAIALSITFFDP